MRDFWNDPPDTTEPPECCDDYMDVLEDGACVCLTCGKRIEPQLDPDPSVFADMEPHNQTTNGNQNGNMDP
jgi:hypothetical protein